MSFRSSLMAAAFTVSVAVAGTVSAPATAEAAPKANTTSCSAFKVSGTASTKLFQPEATLESTLRKDALAAFPTIRICCYKYLGCYICLG
jgi:hypothetical protein